MRSDSRRASGRAVHPAWAPFAAFTAFGIFWGAWGAALPSLRTSAGVSAGALGTALLCIGAGAVPAMAFTGRAVERWGLRVASVLLSALAAAGVLICVVAHGVVPLVVAMLLVGASSGGTDVSINTLAGRAEAASRGPVISRSHGLFSVGVVVSSLATGAVLGAGLPLVATFGLVACVMVGLAMAAARWSAGLTVTRGEAAEEAGAQPAPGSRPLAFGPLLAVGVVAALAFAIENAHQSWGALMLTDVFGARPQLAAAAPAAFAATAALARLGLAPLTRSHPDVVLLGGGGLAAVGSAVLAVAPSVGVALVGLVLAALGTATLFPTLLSRSLRGMEPALQGRATSRVSTTAYVGFLLGPVFVGMLAGGYGVRVALGGVAVLAAVFSVLAVPASRGAAARSTGRMMMAGSGSDA